MRFLLYFALFVFTFSSCKTQQFTPYDYTGEQIKFGQGGGFTGQVTEYTLLSNGQLFAGTNQEGFVDELPRLNSKLVKQIFETCEKYEYDKLELDKPGNQYYFFITKNGEKTNKIQWAPGETNIPNGLVILFENLKEITNRSVLETK